MRMVVLIGLGCCLAACEAEPGAEGSGVDASGVDGGPDAGPADGGPRDGGRLDGGGDAGLVDGGRDAGLEDLGVGPGLGVVVLPGSVLFPGGRGSVERVSVRNDGPGAARVTSLTLRNPSDEAVSTEFTVAGCDALPCGQDIVLCDPTRPDCTSRFVEFELSYANPDRSADDAAILRIEVENRGRIDRVVFATDVPCPIPTPYMQLVPTSTVVLVGETAVIDGAGSDPGEGAQLGVFYWELRSAPGMPSVVGQGSPQLELSPDRAGTFEVGLSVANDCGMPSAAPARLEFEAR